MMSSQSTEAVWEVANLPPLTTPSGSFLPFGLVSFTDRRFEPASFCFPRFSPGGAPLPGTPRLGDVPPRVRKGEGRGPGARAPKGSLAFLRGQRGGRQRGSALGRGKVSKAVAVGPKAGSPSSPVPSLPQGGGLSPWRRSQELFSGGGANLKMRVPCGFPKG